MSKNTLFTDSIAENYEKYRGPLFFEPYAKYFAARLDPVKINSLLEVACGTGQLTRLLRNQLPNARIVATDLSTGMVEIAKKIINPEDNIEWQIANAEELPYDDNTFDAVICQFGMMFLKDKQKGANEVYRVLKSGGRFIFSTWESIEKNPVTKIARDVLLSFFKDNPPDFYNIPFSMHHPEKNKSLLVTAGFKNVSAKNVQCTGYCSSALKAAEAFLIGSPVYLEICERDENLIPLILKALTGEFVKVYGTASFYIPLNALVTEGVK